MMRKNLRTQRKIAMYKIELDIHQRIAAVGGLDAFLEIDARKSLDEHGRSATELGISPEEVKFGVDVIDTVNRQIEEYRQLDCKDVAGVATSATMGVGVGIIGALIEIGVISTVVISTPAIIAIATAGAAALAFAIFYAVRLYRGRDIRRFFSKDVNDMLMRYSTREKGELEELTKAFNKERRKHSDIINRRYIRSIQRQIAEEAEETVEEEGAEVTDKEVIADLEQFQKAMEALKKIGMPLISHRSKPAQIARQCSSYHIQEKWQLSLLEEILGQRLIRIISLDLQRNINGLATGAIKYIIMGQAK